LRELDQGGDFVQKPVLAEARLLTLGLDLQLLVDSDFARRKVGDDTPS